jgi:hypothetical protein
MVHHVNQRRQRTEELANYPPGRLFTASSVLCPLSAMSSLADQIRRAYTGPAWHGDAIAEVLRDVTAAEAATRASPAVHTIAELVGHVGVWVDVARRRLWGEVVDARLTENFAPVDCSTDERWRAALGRLGERHDALARAVTAVGEERMRHLLPGHDFSANEMLHGVISHAAYHAGQMALLRNLIRASR